MAPMPPRWRCDLGSVSGSPTAAVTSNTAPAMVSATKMPRQDVHRSNWPPSTGASTGANPVISNSIEKYLAAAAPVCRSRTTAAATTMPVAPPMPCNNRRTTSSQIDGATAHSTEATPYSTRPAISGRRRPYASDSGPAMSWPTPRPTRQAVSDSCVADAVVCRSLAILGRPGR
jgi:hypothetical protein